MSASPVARRRASNAGHRSRIHSDKSKHTSEHTGTKKETHTKTETHGSTATRRKSNAAEHTNVPSKSDTKKHTSTDTHAKTTHAAASTHTNETTKSHGATIVHATSPRIKVKTQTDTHAKVSARNRLDSQGKSGAYGSAKKPDVRKSQTDKHIKTEQDKIHPEKVDHIEPDSTIKTAVSQDSEKISDEESDNNH